MAVTNRAARIATLSRVARKNYQPVKPPSDRSVLEHMLYACVLEDSTFDTADIAFARVQEAFFDWNEVRVTTAVELAEVMNGLPEPTIAAARLKRTLHSMFESHYSFDIDHLRKENLGKAVQKMEKYKGITPFVVSYVAQSALGGHSIPISKSEINLLRIVGIIDEKEAGRFTVPGLERAIPKNKGMDFFSVVHQLAIAWAASPHNRDLRAILLKIDPESQERFPKRTRTKKAAPASKPAAGKKAAGKPAATKSATAKTATAKKGKATASRTAVARKSSTRKAAGKSSTGRKSAAVGKKKSVKKAASKAGKKRTGKKTVAKKTSKKSPAKRLSKKKPR